MSILIISLSIAVILLLLLIDAYRAAHTDLRLVELRRQRDNGDIQAASALKREELLLQASRLKPIIVGILIVALTLLMVNMLGLFVGAVLALLVVIVSTRLSEVQFIKSVSRKLFFKHENRVFSVIERRQAVIHLIIGKVELIEAERPISSKAELLELINNSKSTFSLSDRRRIAGILEYRHKTVKDVMTKRDDIVSVKRGELLGPLVLDDLHKTGHSCFPVVNQNLDEIIGVLDIRRLTALESKRSLTAMSAMSSEVEYVDQDESLEKALERLKRSRHRLLVVRNKSGDTAGIVSLGDIIGVILR